MDAIKFRGKKMLIDSYIFHNEVEMLEFRMKLLWDVVDKFVVVEADRTHSGKAKPFILNESIFSWAKEKLVYYRANIDVFDLNLDYKPTSYEPDSPHWKIENRQRSAIIDACKYFSDDDIIMVSDCDEIPSLESINFRKINPIQYPMSCDQFIIPLNLNCFNNTSSWRGTVMCDLGYARKIGTQKLRDMRNQFSPFPKGGWHLSYFGGAERISNKIKSFAHQELNKPEITDEDYIKNCLNDRIDFITGKPGGLKRIEKDFYPQYFLDKAPDQWWDNKIEGEQK